MHSCRFRRYVMEDRFTAIRWAIGTAQKKDIVVIAGKGHHDYQEWDLGVGGLLKVTKNPPAKFNAFLGF